jgi:hypothetical protein
MKRLWRRLETSETGSRASRTALPRIAAPDGRRWPEIDAQDMRHDVLLWL